MTYRGIQQFELDIMECLHEVNRNLDCDDCRKAGDVCIEVCAGCGADWELLKEQEGE